MVNTHVLAATGVNADGDREILGVDICSAEPEAGCLTLFRGLNARRLSGVKLVTSHAHSGLVAAMTATLDGAAWQRCRHSLRGEPDVRDTEVVVGLGQDGSASIYDRVIDTSDEKLPVVAEHLEEARADILAFTAFPKEIWRRIWSNDPNERLNREIRRRTDVVGTSPDRNSAIWLIGAVLAEQHDDWADGRRYLGLEVLGRSRMALINTDKKHHRTGEPDTRRTLCLECSHRITRWPLHPPRPWTRPSATRRAWSSPARFP